MRKLTQDNYVQMPWKNSGGVTTQLAVAPDDATLDTFDWRISTAHVMTAGPFSAFPCIDRSLSVLQGAGLIFQIDGGTPFLLTAETSPLPFDGQKHVHAELIDGPILDFNVMTRRGRCSHLLNAMRVDARTRIIRHADLLFVYCVSGGAVHCSTAGGKEICLSVGDAILADHTDGEYVELCVTGAANVTVTHIKLKETDRVQ